MKLGVNEPDEWKCSVQQALQCLVTCGKTPDLDSEVRHLFCKRGASVPQNSRGGIVSV